MRRLGIALMLLGVLAFPAAVAAHPSEGRDEHGSNGPHCHVNLMSGHFTFPSHSGHAAQLQHKPNGTVFMAVDCP